MEELEKLLGQGKVGLMDYIIAMHAKIHMMDHKINALIEMQTTSLLTLNPENEEKIREHFAEIMERHSEKGMKSFLEWGAEHIK